MSKDHKEQITERRKQPRRDVSLWVEEHSLNSRYFHLVTNMSLGGLFFQKELPFPIGHKVHFKMKLPGNSEKLSVQGIVMENYRDSGYRGAGIKFINFSEPAQEAIDKFLTDPCSKPLNDS